MLVGGKMPEDTNFLSPATMSVLRSVENISRYPSNRLCLFGKPDPAVTAKIISEQFDSERQRVIERWGFDIFSESFTVNPGGENKVRKSQKALSEDKENIDITSGVNVVERTAASGLCESKKVNKKNKLENSGRKKSLKMTSEKSHLRKARQSHVTDYWRSRKFSESSSCSDKEN